MDYPRILACKKVRTASMLAHNSRCRRPIRETTPGWYLYQVLRREAALWNMITCLAKGKEAQALQHASICDRSRMMQKAKQRWQELRDWAERHPEEARTQCEPLIREYAERERKRKSVIA